MSADCRVGVRFYPPPPDLERFFTTFYCVDIDVSDGASVEDALHPEWANLRIFSGCLPSMRNAAGAALSGADVVAYGPSSLPLEFSFGSIRLWGIGLLPCGWATFVDQPADAFANTVHDARRHPAFARFVPLADAVLAKADEAAQLAEIIAFFRHAAPRTAREDPRIAAIHAMLVEPELPQVADLAAGCGLNQRTLERLCRRHFGFSPKLLLSRQRFMRSLVKFMLDPSLRWIGAIDLLYFDQSHFVRDCKKFLGETPSDYMARPHPVMAQFVRERMRAYGSPVQTLDPPDRHLPVAIDG